MYWLGNTILVSFSHIGSKYLIILVLWLAAYLSGQYYLSRYQILCVFKNEEIKWRFQGLTVTLIGPLSSFALSVLPETEQISWLRRHVSARGSWMRSPWLTHLVTIKKKSPIIILGKHPEICLSTQFQLIMCDLLKTDFVHLKVLIAPAFNWVLLGKYLVWV